MLWARLDSAANLFAGSAGLLQAAAELAGLLGFTLFALSLVLAARWQFIENTLDGLNKAFIIHHLVGTLTLLVLLAHPILLAARFLPAAPYQAAQTFIPNLHYPGPALGILALSTLMILLALTFFVALKYQVWLKTHKFLGVAFILGGLHILLTPNGLTADLLLYAYLIGIYALGSTAYLYRTVIPGLSTRRFKYQIAAARQLPGGVAEFEFMPLGRPMRYVAGQFVFVSLRGPGLPREWHPFSISSGPLDGRFRLTIKGLGPYTKFLTVAGPQLIGTTVMVEGSYGRFNFAKFRNPHQIWVAGGIGITPFLSLAQSLAQEPAYGIDLYYSVKTEAELIDYEELKWAADRSVAVRQFRLIPYIASQQPGFLTAQYINETSGGLAGKDILICGPPPMMRSLRQQFLSLGAKPQQIHSEEFSMS